MMIIGAGLSGLIAGYYFNCPIFEKQSILPNNHHAVLRFKTDVISKITNIPFQKVYMRKGIVYDSNFIDQPNIFICNEYSLKVSGAINSQRSIWNLEDGYRYISPKDFIQQLAAKCKITVKTEIEKEQLFRKDTIISTIPMPQILNILGIKGPEFHYRTAWVINCEILGIDLDIYQTLYFPALHQPWYRASLTGNQLIIEMVEKIDDSEVSIIIEEVLEYFGIPKGAYGYENVIYKEQQYGKIINIDEETRKTLMWGLTKDYNIYSLGRFATWRPILLDDLGKDLQVIRSLISMEEKHRGYYQSLRMIKQ
jgi:hypothetical protein